MIRQYTVHAFQQLHDGKELTLYCGVISAEELIATFHIPQFSSVTNTGYQRPAIEHRLRAISSYVVNKGGLMPTSVLVNVREGAKFTPSPKDPRWGTLTIADGVLLEVMDGQHRTKGLLKAKERREPLPYDLPIVFTIDLDEQTEAQIFYTVNHEAKNVPTDLTFELLSRRIAQSADAKIDSKGQISAARVSDPELRLYAATEVTKMLAADGGGAWFGRIQLADEYGKKDTKPIRSATMVRCLQKVFDSDWAHTYVITRNHQVLFRIVSAFWLGIALVMPKALGDPKNYSIQGPTGVWVGSYLLKDFAVMAYRANNWSPEFFAGKFRSLQEWAEDDHWHKVDGHPMTKAKGAQIARLIMEDLSKLYSDELHSQFNGGAELPGVNAVA